MTVRSVFRLPLLALLLWTTQAVAMKPEDEARLKSLEFALAQANLAQQSVHTQFQMITEIRRVESEQYRVTLPEAGVASPPRNYDDLVKLRADNEQRSRQTTEELSRLYARFNEIEQEKQALRDQIRQLLESR